jgi:hypothetical protein
MTDDEKGTFLSKVKALMESQTIDFNDKDSNMILAVVTDVLREINQEFEDAFGE